VGFREWHDRGPQAAARETKKKPPFTLSSGYTAAPSLDAKIIKEYFNKRLLSLAACSLVTATGCEIYS
jgi:hypothetical protein